MLIVTGKRVLLDSASPIRPATLQIENGKIVSIELDKYCGGLASSSSDHLIDAGDSIVMAGIVDCHVHINEPGRTEWEGFATATCAAAAGGVTTLFDMPLNALPPTTAADNFRVKLDAAEDHKLFVNVGFYGGVIPGNQEELAALVQMGVSGFKCFMIESGVDEFPYCRPADIEQALEVLSKIPKTFLMFHAEMDSNKATENIISCCGPKRTDPVDYQTFLDSRPCELENSAIDVVIDLCRRYQSRCHIVHLSSAEALPAIRKAKAESLPLTVETCFHYLHFDADHIPKGATQYKCCPPIRDLENKKQLWAAVLDGTIDYVVSDHSPCTANLKVLDKGDFMEAWGGIASVQFGLSALWTAGQEFGLQFHQVARLLCENTAQQVGLADCKGRLAPGFDADIVIWNPDTQFTVEKSDLLFKNKLTPYEGKILKGKVEKTILSGKLIYDSRTGVDKTAYGKICLSR